MLKTMIWDFPKIFIYKRHKTSFNVVAKFGEIIKGIWRNSDFVDLATLVR